MTQSKDDLRKSFSKNWEKHYKIDYLVKQGFRRKICKNCGRGFWTLDESRERCADASCVGFEFIGSKTKELDYIETWKQIEKFFESRGHKSIKRYPTVCRWRDDLYFTNASIIDFQPYVVSGEVEPPANPLIVPQTCLRFGDISNVGLTGSHYTCFVMFGQHAFNSKKLFYWKPEALALDFEYVTKVLGAKKEDIVFSEEVWVGGGNFGPSMEYCVKGLELGNCVFMQFKDLGNGKSEELKTKVIDMGAGLERLAWFTNGTNSSFEITFPTVIKYLKSNTGVKVNEKLFKEFAKLSGIFNEEKDSVKAKKIIQQKMNVGSEFFEEIAPLQALYATADHLKTILYTSTDGMLPSNSGGGYNLRMILRRVFGFENEFGFKVDLEKVLELHADYLKKMDETVLTGLDSAKAIVAEEKKKYDSTMDFGRKKLNKIIEAKISAKKSFEERELAQLYESDGIPAETVKEFSAKQGLNVEIPLGFYERMAKKDEIAKEKTKKTEVKKFPPTKALFYENAYLKEFTAKVLGAEGNFVILDKTAFYGEAGGQIGDSGTLNGIPVTETLKQNNVILHKVDEPKKFKKGQTVKGAIDWNKRFSLMKHHSATHLLNAVCRKFFGNHIWQAGALKEAEKSHLDLTHYKKISSEELMKIELMVNELIQENLPISTEILPRTTAEQKYGFRIYQGGFVPGKELRIVKIEGLDAQACGGTHLNSTGEIGFFKILKREGIKDGIERIEFAVGLASLKFVQREKEILEKTADILSVPAHKTDATIERIFREWKELRKQLGKTTEQSIEKETQKHLNEEEKPKGLLVWEDQTNDINYLTKLTGAVVEVKTNLTAVAFAGDIIVINAGKNSSIKANDLMQKLKQKAEIAGGGNELLARGKAKDTEKLKKAVNELK